MGPSRFDDRSRPVEPGQSPGPPVDYAVEPVGMQCQTYGLAMWLPYFGNCGGQIDKYVFRSTLRSAPNTRRVEQAAARYAYPAWICVENPRD